MHPNQSQQSRQSKQPTEGRGYFVFCHLLALLSLSALIPSSAQATPTVTITDTSGATQTNRPVSIAQPFKQGDVLGSVQASVNGANVLTQTDIKNTWPDGSLKFAIVSFVIPSLPANGSVMVSFNGGGANTNYPLTQSQMLDSAYNFDGQIQLSGGASHNISARAILTAAGSCNDPGNDPDAGKYLCTYWLKGPIVTAVILEDRLGRSFDVNTDGGAGNPLHPIFEAWFYPQNHAVQLGYTLEDDWASANPQNSARDQTYSYVLTAGNSSPVTVYTQPSETVLTRTRWHKTFCISAAGTSTPNGCEISSLTIDHNWAYLAQTKLFLNWDPTFRFTAGGALPTPSNFVSAWTSPTTNKSDTLNSNGLGFYPGYNTPCGDSNRATTGDQCGGDVGFDEGGQNYYHGPLTTWDIDCLMSQDPDECDLVTLGSADVSGGVPYWFREADTNPGGLYFDSPRNTVVPQGRAISINDRENLDTADVTTTQGSGGCPTFPSQFVNYGGSGQDLGPWGGQLDTSHWPNTSFVAYTRTGQYNYYEQQVMQGANAVGNVGGAYACSGSLGHRQGALGYWNYLDGDRTEMWNARETALGATVAMDGSPEQAYLTDKLRANLAVLEANHGIPCDIPGTGVQEPYCGSTNNTAYGFGLLTRGGTTVNTNDYQFAGPPTGSAFGGVSIAVGYSGSGVCVSGDTGCTPGYGANSNFMNAYSSVMLGWLDDLGFCPHVKGVCQLVQTTQNWYINVMSDPNGPGMYILGDYTYLTIAGSLTTPAPLTSLASMKQYYEVGQYPRPSSVWNNAECYDEGYAAESAAALSYGASLNSTANPGYTGPVGYSGATAYNTLRSALLASCTGAPPFSLSPKWDIVPRPGSAPPPPPPNSSCDVNGDGQVNVADVQKEVMMVLQLSPCTNPSGQCTVIQVEDVVNAVLGGQCVAL